MGYRNYFYLVEKSEVSKVRGMNYDELCDYAKQCGASHDEDEDERGFDFIDERFMNKKLIFEFGKLYWDDTIERIHKVGMPLFDDQDIQEIFNEPYEPYITGKVGLETAIEIYKNKVVEYLKSLVNVDADDTSFLLSQIRPDKLDLKAVCSSIRGKLAEWGSYPPYNLNEHTDKISSSWCYEYQIFELVRLYKTIDWDKYVLLFMGW